MPVGIGTMVPFHTPSKQRQRAAPAFALKVYVLKRHECTPVSTTGRIRAGRSAWRQSHDP